MKNTSLMRKTNLAATPTRIPWHGGKDFWTNRLSTAGCRNSKPPFPASIRTWYFATRFSNSYLHMISTPHTPISIKDGGATSVARARSSYRENGGRVLKGVG